MCVGIVSRNIKARVQANNELTRNSSSWTLRDEKEAKVQVEACLFSAEWINLFSFNAILIEWCDKNDRPCFANHKSCIYLHTCDPPAPFSTPPFSVLEWLPTSYSLLIFSTSSSYGNFIFLDTLIRFLVVWRRRRKKNPPNCRWILRAMFNSPPLWAIYANWKLEGNECTWREKGFSLLKGHEAV